MASKFWLCMNLVLFVLFVYLLIHDLTAEVPTFGGWPFDIVLLIIISGCIWGQSKLIKTKKKNR